MVSLDTLNRDIQEMEYEVFHIDEIIFYREKAL